MRTGTIYYIASLELNRVKIGYTKGNPKARLRALQTGSPARLTLLAMHEGTPEIERGLHAKFGRQRAHGEWFDMCEELFVHMCGACSMAADRARALGQEPPTWALLGMQAFDDACSDRPSA